MMYALTYDFRRFSFAPLALLGMLTTAAVVVAQPAPPNVFAPKWVDSLPFVSHFDGETVETSSSPGGSFETRTDQWAELGVSAADNKSKAGTAWFHIANELGLDPNTQVNGGQNDWEATYFDGRGGAVRMSAKNCPPPVNGVQDYSDSTAAYQPCQCSLDVTPNTNVSNGLNGCTLPTKYSCLPMWESCVPTEVQGCPLTEMIQRRSWGYAPPTCKVRPLDGMETGMVPPGLLPWANDTDFAVCKSTSAFSGQIEATSMGGNDEGIPAYDVEGRCNPSHQSSYCFTSYLANSKVENITAATFFDTNPKGFVNCLGAVDAAAASNAFCNGRGEWMFGINSTRTAGIKEPSPFWCNCFEPMSWTGDRCDVALCQQCHSGTSGPCQHDTLGDMTCTDMLLDGSCPVGFSRCGHAADPPRIPSCSGCFGQTSGPCKNLGNNVCYNFHFGTTCPPGTQQC